MCRQVLNLPEVLWCDILNLFLSSYSDVLPYGIYMLVYRQAADYLDNTEFVRRRRARPDGSNINLIVTTFAGAWAGILSWVCVIPFDVVKTIMQADENHKFRGIMHCVRVNYRAYGWRSIFRGSWMLLARAVPFNAATFVGYEYSLELCHTYWTIIMHN